MSNVFQLMLKCDCLTLIYVFANKMSFYNKNRKVYMVESRGMTNMTEIKQ